MRPNNPAIQQNSGLRRRELCYAHRTAPGEPGRASRTDAANVRTGRSPDRASDLIPRTSSSRRSKDAVKARCTTVTSSSSTMGRGPLRTPATSTRPDTTSWSRPKISISGSRRRSRIRRRPKCRSNWGFSPGTRVGRRSTVPITGVPFTAMAAWSSSAFRSGPDPRDPAGPDIPSRPQPKQRLEPPMAPVLGNGGPPAESVALKTRSRAAVAP